jgi:transcriptional regulator with XRE-family HTH domain
MNYRRLRQMLRQERLTAHLSLDKLAGRTGLNRATIHSVENIRREPNLKPDLDTIDKIVTACGGTLASFFTKVEQEPSAQRSRLEHSAAAPIQEPTVTSLVAHGSPDPSLSAIPEALLISVSQNLALVLERAVDRIVAARTAERPPRKQAATARADAAVRHGRHRRVG